MWKYILVSALLNTFLIRFTYSYRTDITEGEEEGFCMHQKHLAFKPTSTCCMGKVVKPGLITDANWDACVDEVGGQSNTIEQISWDMYSCLIKKASGGEKDEITLQELSNLMTTSYSDDIKSKINEEVQAQSLDTAPLTDHEKLALIRATYYDIEQEVCEGMPSETKSYGKTEPCMEWKEENHRGGICCKQAYPVDIRHRSVMDLGDRHEVMNTCQTTFKDDLKKLNLTDLMQSSLMEMCDVACALNQKGKLDFHDAIINNREYWNWNWTKEFEARNLYPRILHQDLIQRAWTYINSTYTVDNSTDTVKNFEFADTVSDDPNIFRPVYSLTLVKTGNNTEKDADRFKVDFMRRRFHEKMLHVPIICMGYKEVINLLEYNLFNSIDNCRKEDVAMAEQSTEATESTR